MFQKSGPRKLHNFQEGSQFADNQDTVEIGFTFHSGSSKLRIINVHVQSICSLRYTGFKFNGMKKLYRRKTNEIWNNQKVEILTLNLKTSSHFSPSWVILLFCWAKYLSQTVLPFPSPRSITLASPLEKFE